jgi:hypothetical protein
MLSGILGGGRESDAGKVEAYTPAEQPLGAGNAQPGIADPTLGIDNNADKTKQGKASLTIPKSRNLSVGVGGGTTASGVTVPSA